MEDLLTNDFILHYNLQALAITNWFIKTNEIYFEIEDTNAGEIALHTLAGKGMARFSNFSALEITIINYDKFITSLQDTFFKKNRQRCDILLDSENNRYFILGEIKDRKILNSISRKNVRSIAKKQLISTLQTILDVPEIETYVNQKNIKRCCYFNKQSASPINLTATSAFNRLPTFFRDGFKMKKTDIEAFGFEFYEYTGDQTMILAE